jgi:isoquinoline 1-oxidoreductase beta subunit
MKVFSQDREGVAVVADSTGRLCKEGKALKILWDDSGFDHPSTDQMYNTMRQ